MSALAPPLPTTTASRIALLSDGLDAFAARVAAARGARQTLDLQYYIWQGDLTGQLLAREVLAAADRGVRVRMLLDDMYILGRAHGLTALAAHPMIALRRFNATRLRDWGRTGLLLEMVFGKWNLNRRMHNKAWIADRALVICGGRNIGDRYFDASGEINFRDLDVAVRGDPAAAAAVAFDAYWHSPLSRPIRGFRLRTPKALLRRLRVRLDWLGASSIGKRFLAHADPSAGQMLTLPPGAIRVLSDPPAKAAGRAPSSVAPALTEMVSQATREVLLISPYFVPGGVTAARLSALVAEGVRVAVVTNSLAATDVIAVHGGYARYRESLLAAGVEIFELKHASESKAGVFGSRGASLHTKAIVVDDRLVFVGSFNLDPRSANLNTEMGVLAEGPVLARLVRRQHARLSQGGRSWRLGLAGGVLQWDDGTASPRTGAEPEASLVRRVLSRVLRWLPIEEQL